MPPTETPRLPTLAELDEAVPDNPAYISEAFAGPSATNSLGKAFFESRGIPVSRWQRQNLYFGGVQAVASGPGGELQGGGDPRRGGAVVVVE